MLAAERFYYHAEIVFYVLALLFSRRAGHTRPNVCARQN